MKLYDLGATVLIGILVVGGLFTAYKTSPEFKQGVNTAKGRFNSTYDKYVEPYRDKSQPEWAREAFTPEN